MNRVYLSIGSNVDPVFNIIKGINALRQRAIMIAASRFYTTVAVGEGQGEFVNVALCFQTRLEREAFAAILRQIEATQGRDRTQKAIVTLDIDIVIWGDAEPDSDVYRYAYIAVPLAEIAPTLCLPNGETVRQVVTRLQQGANE